MALPVEMEMLIDGLFGLVDLQELKNNVNGKTEVDIEVDTFEQATQIFAYLMEHYHESFEIATEIGLYEKNDGGGQNTFKLNKKWWCINHSDDNEFTDDVLIELVGSSTITLDLRRMVW